MEMRNLKYNHAGTVDAEINHPVYAWIPCTLSPDDAVTAPLHAEAISGKHGVIASYVAPIPTAIEKRAALQQQIDSLERQQLMPRVTREALLGIAVQQYTALGLTEAQAYAANIGYKKLRDFEVSIVALRDQLGAIK